MNKTWENGKKPNFESNFGPNLGPQIFFVSFPSIRYCYTLLQANIVYNVKEN